MNIKDFIYEYATPAWHENENPGFKRGNSLSEQLIHDPRDFLCWWLDRDPLTLTQACVATLLNVDSGTLAIWRRDGVGPRWASFGGEIRYLAYSVQQVMWWLEVERDPDGFHSYSTYPNREGFDGPVHVQLL